MLKIKTEQGLLGGIKIYRSYVVDGINYVREFNVERIQTGYGETQEEAIKNFILRNKSEVLDIIFNEGE